ncbi:DUF2490 domain-containing protein [Thermaurantiacus sp.]
MHRLLALLAVALPARADDSQLWTSLLVQGPVSGGVWLWFDTSLRFTNDSDRLGQTLVRGALGTRLAPGVTAFGGYAFILTDPPARPALREHRPWQQLAYPIITGNRAQIVGRTRLEQRFREDAGGMSLRLRQLMRATVPLGGPQAPRALGWYEGFVTLSKAGWSPEPGFDQHRGFVGLGVPVGRNAIETGYFVQRFPQAQPDIVNRAFHLTLVVNLPGPPAPQSAAPPRP